MAANRSIADGPRKNWSVGGTSAGAGIAPTEGMAGMGWGWIDGACGAGGGAAAVSWARRREGLTHSPGLLSAMLERSRESASISGAEGLGPSASVSAPTTTAASAASIAAADTAIACTGAATGTLQASFGQVIKPSELVGSTEQRDQRGR